MVLSFKGYSISNSIGWGAVHFVRPTGRIIEWIVDRVGDWAKIGVACLKRLWCGMGSKLKKLCETVWTQNGGDICQNLCYVGI